MPRDQHASPVISVVLLALLAVAWGAIPLLVRTDIPSTHLVAMRVTLGAVVLLVYTAATSRISLPKTGRGRLVLLGVVLANLTPDKIKATEMVAVDIACQKHLRRLIELLEPQYLIGVGAYAEKKMALAKEELGVDGTVGKILHPSPASPAANRGWAEAAEKQLRELGIW